jgi:hypothetical protein
MTELNYDAIRARALIAAETDDSEVSYQVCLEDVPALLVQIEALESAMNEAVDYLSVGEDETDDQACRLLRRALGDFA